MKLAANLIFFSIFAFSHSFAYSNENGKIEPPKTTFILQPVVPLNPEIEAIRNRPPAEVLRPNFKSEWTKVRETEEKDFYINIGEIFRLNNILEIPVLFNYKKTTQKELASETAKVKIDCSNSKWTISNLMGWSKQMGDGGTVHFDNRQLEWSSVDSRSTGDVFATLQRDFCNTQSLGVRPQLTKGRTWAPMVGKNYEEQIRGLFKSHIVLKEDVAPESFIEVLISVDVEGAISETKTVSQGGDPRWEEAVINSIKLISNRYQIRSPRGYGNSGKIEIRFRP